LPAGHDGDHQCNIEEILAGSALGTYRAMRHTARVLDLIDDPISRDHIAKAFEVAR
jgi:hypothetical protein